MVLQMQGYREHCRFLNDKQVMSFIGTLSWQEFMKKDYSDLVSHYDSKFNKQIKAAGELHVVPTREPQPATPSNLIE